MATKLSIFLDEHDELHFLSFLKSQPYLVYPHRPPPDWKPYAPSPEMYSELPTELYLLAKDCGPALVDKVKRGKDKGSWHVDEVRSPVIFWERNVVGDEPNEIIVGQIWAETDVTPQTGRKSPGGPDQFRRTFVELENYFKRSCRRSNPPGHYIGPSLARAVKSGERVLRIHPVKPGTVTPHH